MQLPAAIGFGSALLLIGLLLQGRGWYLDQASRKIDVDAISTIELRPAIWSYLGPILGICVGLVFLAFAWRSTGGGTVVSGTLGLVMVSIGVWWIWSLGHTCAVIDKEKLTYSEGRTRQEIIAGEVLSVGMYWFSFRVRLAWDRQVFVPATFQSSEIILAFLRHAANKNAERA